jgi:hypothetical protein
MVDMSEFLLLSYPDNFSSASLRRWYYSSVRRNVCVKFSMVQIWLTLIILSINHLSTMENTDITNFRYHMKGGDSAILHLPKFNPDPWSPNLHTRSF